MTKIFYDHLIIIEDVIAVFSEHKITSDEQQKLLSVIDEMMHHEIFDVILTHLPKAHHQEFLHRMLHHPYDPGILEFLKDKTTVNIEKEIIRRASTVKRRVIKQIRKSARKG